MVSFMMFDTGLAKYARVRSLAYEADSHALLMECKSDGVGSDCHRKDSSFTGCRLPLNRAEFRQTLTILQVPLNECRSKTVEDAAGPDPTWIDPFKEALVFIASHEHGLAVLHAMVMSCSEHCGTPTAR